MLLCYAPVAARQQRGQGHLQRGEGLLRPPPPAAGVPPLVPEALDVGPADGAVEQLLARGGPRRG
eukprot:1385295-Pyramimonas_sp.AAC.1